MRPEVPALRLLFANLKAADYQWEPQTPDRLLAFRREPHPFRPLVQLFGLGLPVSREDLVQDGLGEGTIKVLQAATLENPLLADASGMHDGAELRALLRANMAVSGSGDLMIVHDHWPPRHGELGGYVHYAAESAWLGRALSDDLEGFISKRVLDLGCSSGALAFEAAAVADRVLGLDISARAIEWARLSAGAHGFRNTRFEVAAVGEPAAEDAVAKDGPWDIVVMNPPMVIPSKDASYGHRDGGELGVALPLVFLDFAHRHLKSGGEVLTLVTNPIVHGRPVFFERFDKAASWDSIERRCLHSRFNQSVARKEGYAERGIERVELWFLHLKKA